MWCSEDPGKPDITYVFLDTEGLSSTSRSESYDARIFALALLLSSYFIYNSVGTIDGAAISKLVCESRLVVLVIRPWETLSNRLSSY